MSVQRGRNPRPRHDTFWKSHHTSEFSGEFGKDPYVEGTRSQARTQTQTHTRVCENKVKGLTKIYRCKKSQNENEEEPLKRILKGDDD